MSALPAPARAIRAATLEAVDAARAQEVEPFDAATAALAAADPEQVRLVLGLVVRDLLERLHPDGVSGDDLLDLIKACVRSNLAWYPAIDVQVLVVVLTGSMGVHEPDEEPRKVTPDEVARHAPLFLTELLKAPAAGSLDDHLDAAFADLARQELNEMP